VAGFVFPFESILKLKIQIEKKEKNDFSKAMQRLNMEKKALNDLFLKRDAIVLEFKGKNGTLKVRALKGYSDYLERLKEETEAQKKVVKASQETVDILKERVTKAMKERKIFENLKEKKYRAFLIEEQKKEQKRTDAFISYKRSQVV
jgi:flagellar protein FliJ